MNDRKRDRNGMTWYVALCLLVALPNAIIVFVPGNSLYVYNTLTAGLLLAVGGGCWIVGRQMGR